MLSLMGGGVRSLLLVAIAAIIVTAAGHAQDGGPAGSTAAKSGGPAPAQPIAFDHKLHAETAKMTCNDCHAPRGDGTVVAMPQAPKCMVCHASVAAGKPDIQRLAAAAKNEDPIAWVRVYRVPSFVTFSHKTHAGSACEECHGPVAEQTAISLWKDTHMGTCIACHQAKQAPAGCDTCHAIQSRNGHSPFEIDGATLARLRLAPARPATVIGGSIPLTQPLAVALSSFCMYLRCSAHHNRLQTQILFGNDNQKARTNTPAVKRSRLLYGSGLSMTVLPVLTDSRAASMIRTTVTFVSSEPKRP